MPVFYDDESRQNYFNAEFRKDKGLPTAEDEAVQVAAEKEVEIRKCRVREQEFSDKVETAANKMEGPSAKEAHREDPYIPMPSSLKTKEEPSHYDEN